MQPGSSGGMWHVLWQVGLAQRRTLVSIACAHVGPKSYINVGLILLSPVLVKFSEAAAPQT